MSFFVVGLPRSRTAWMSVFLSQSGTFCHHEGLNGCNSLADYQLKINGCGDSSTGLMLIELNELFPDSPIVVIEKDEKQLKHCINWCDAIYGGDSANYIHQLNDQLLGIKGLRVKQSDINERLQEIWDHLTDSPWSDKYEQIKNLNIQSDPFNIDTQAAKVFFSELLQ